MEGKDFVTDAEPGKVAASSCGDLAAKRIRLLVETALADGKERNMNLDEDLVAGLVARNEPFDRKKMSFLEQYARAGKDPNEYLRELLDKRTLLTPENERKVTDLHKTVKRAIKAMNGCPPELYGNLESEIFKLLAEKAASMVVAILAAATEKD